MYLMDHFRFGYSVVEDGLDFEVMADDENAFVSDRNCLAVAYLMLDFDNFVAVRGWHIVEHSDFDLSLNSAECWEVRFCFVIEDDPYCFGLDSSW